MIRIYKVLSWELQTRFLEQTFGRTSMHRYISESEKKRWRLRVTRRWSALRPADVIGRTLIASEPIEARNDAVAWGGRRKVGRKRKDPLASRYYDWRSGKGHREFSRIISKRLSTYLHFPSIFIVSRWLCLCLRPIFRPLGCWVSDFRTLSQIRKVIVRYTGVSSTIFSPSDQYLAYGFIDVSVRSNYEKNMFRSVNTSEFNGAI